MRGYQLAGEERFDAREVLKAVQSVLPKRRPIGHHEPCINGKEAAYVRDCIDRGVVSYEYVERFERAIVDRVGTSYSICTSSGTAALHVVLLACGVNPGDEVLVPTLTFAATANAVSYVGAIPNFVDGSLSINACKLARYLERETKPAPDKRGRINRETGRPIRVIVLVHLLGSPADIPRVFEVAKAFGLEVIEDAAEAMGSISGNSHCGSYGLAGIFSFNNNKIITTNGGGAIVTNDEWIAAKCKQLVNTARIPHPWLIEHDAIAFNYTMGNLNAALGLAQLEQLDTFIDAKRRLADRYSRAIADCRGVQYVIPNTGSNHWLTAILVDPRWVGGRDEILQTLHSDGICARCIFSPLHSLPQFSNCSRDGNLMYAEDYWKRLICLPSGTGLIDDAASCN